MNDKLKRLEEIRIETNNLYIEKQSLEKEIIQHFIDNKELFNEIELDNHIATLKWVYEKEIDYEKLEELYPEIYILGLRPKFSRKQLLKVIDDVNMIKLILRECTYNTSHYKLQLKNKRKKYKRGE